MRQKSRFKIFFFSICILLGFILLAHVILISVIYTIRVSIGNEYLVLQENVLEKIYILNKVITSANRVIAYDPRQKAWSEVMNDLWNFNSPVMGERVITEKIRDDVLVRILGEDPLHVKERRDRTLEEYEETLQEVFRLASLLRHSTSDEQRSILFLQYQREMQYLLLTANQHNDELMQIEGAYFSYLNQNLSRTMTLLSRLTYSLIIFALFTGVLVIVFLLERRRAEMTLTNMNVNLENILKASIPLCVTNREYTIIQANEAYTIMFGQSPEEVVGMKCYDSRPGSTCNTPNCSLQRLLKGAEEAIHEVQKTKLDGSEVYCIVTARPFRSNRGELIGIVESFQDITKRKQVEDRVNRLNVLNEELLISADLDEKLTWITTGVVNIFNADFARIWVIQGGDLCDRSCVHAGVTEGPHVCQDRDMCLHLKASSGRYTHINGTMHRRVPKGCYKIGRVAAGDDPKFLTNDVVHDPDIHDHNWVRRLGLVSFAGYKLLSDAGQAIGVLALFSKHAISPEEDALLDGLARSTSQVIQKAVAEEELRKARDAADAANQAKSIFLANMSHELRTPLNAILGFAQIMGHNPHIPSEEQEHLNIIRRSGDHLLTLINQVLNLSKIEAGRVTLNNKNFDLHRLIDDLYNMFTFKAQKKALQLLFECDIDVPQWICTDEVKLRQVLINLLNNAIKFTQEGSVQLSVSSKQLLESSDELNTDHCLLNTAYCLLFTVKDTGPGIASEEIDRLFEAFVQTESGRQAQEGTGLGLLISRKFVQLMGGDIHVESEVGKGTTFTFEIQAEAIDQSTIANQQSPIQKRPIGLEPGQPHYRLLIVDDKQDNRKFLVKLLNPFGFDLREATNGQEALELWQLWHPHLIWMDLRMPVIDGYTATQKIRNSQSEIRNIPIIAVSASAFEEERSVALSKGFNDFLRKPFREADIFEMMRVHLGVRFVYEETPKVSSSQKETAQPELDYLPAALASVPFNLLAQLEKAAIAGAADRVEQVIVEIRSHHFTLAQALARFAENFDYGKIITAVQQSKFSPFTPEAFATLPDDILAALQEAIEVLNVETVNNLIEQIRPKNELFADALAKLVKEYRFDTLQKLFEHIGISENGTHE